MNIGKSKAQKASDTDKAFARPGLEALPKDKNKVPSKISPDTIIAEKDEVKKAEEKLRERTNKKRK